MSWARGPVALLLLLQATLAPAESVWVSDRLQAGLHEERSPASTVLVLLPSGTEVEVLERDGAVVFVRTASGAEGWVDAQYLSDTRPAALLLAETEAERARAAAALEAAQERIAELESELVEAQRSREEPAEQTPAVQSAAFEAPVSSETLRELQRVAEENQDLKQRLAESEAAAEMALERLQIAAAKPSPVAAPEAAQSYDHFLLALRFWTPWQWLVLGSVLLLFFAMGLLTADLGVRRRHGGFRLRV